MRSTRAAFSVFLLALSVAGVARAQEKDGDAADTAAEARRQYNRGTQAYAAKRFAEAAQSFEGAAAYKPHAVTLFTAALAWEQAGRPERAADDYSRALEVPGLTLDQERSAKDKLGLLERQLGTAKITGPDGAKVVLDLLTEVPTPARLHASPGAHVLTYTMPGKAAAKRDVKLEEGKTLVVDLASMGEAETSVPPATPPAAAKRPAVPDVRGEARTDAEIEPAPVRLRRSLGLVAVGIGVAGLGAAALLGAEGLSARDAFDESPTRTSFDHAQSLQTWTNVMLVGGAVFLAGGVVLYLLPATASRVRVGVGPSGGGGASASLAGSF